MADRLNPSFDEMINDADQIGRDRKLPDEQRYELFKKMLAAYGFEVEKTGYVDEHRGRLYLSDWKIVRIH